jgi:integrase
MCAAKTSSRPTLQRVALHLYRRGNSFEFRKVIPPRARHAFQGGVATFSRSFGDVSRKEAEHLAAECRKYCDRLIAGATSKPDPTARTATFKAGAHVPDREEIDRAVRAWLSDQEQRADGADFKKDDAKRRVKELALIAEITPSHQREDRQGSLLTTRWIAESLIEGRQWTLPVESPLFDHLNDRVGRAQRELALRLKAELNFEDRPSPTHAMFDPLAFAQDQFAPAPSSAPVPIMETFESYVAERQPAAKTVKKFRVALSALIAHLGHDDAARVTAEDIVAWKSALLTPLPGKKPLNPRTVRNGYLGGIKPAFGWATENKKLPVNPTAGITVKAKPREAKRVERGYSDAEAKVVLKAALAIDWRADASFGVFARRWLPWLCAYSGARVTEMAQLRRRDVLQSPDGIWHLVVTPDAGSVKNRKARQIALHEHLLEQGFLQAIEGRSGPLFFDPSRKGVGSTANSQARHVGERIARWVRGLGLDDEELQPNHGWRHAFISRAYKRINDDVSRAITGHGKKDEHAAYGNVSLETIHDALNRFPRYEI